MNNTIQQKGSHQSEAYHTLSALLTSIAAGYGIWGIRNMLVGYGKGIPAACELGEKQIKMGATLAILAVYIGKGTLPPPEMMEYLTSR